MRPMSSSSSEVYARAIGRKPSLDTIEHALALMVLIDWSPKEKGKPGKVLVNNCNRNATRIITVTNTTASFRVDFGDLQGCDIHEPLLHHRVSVKVKTRCTGTYYDPSSYR